MSHEPLLTEIRKQIVLGLQNTLYLYMDHIYMNIYKAYKRRRG
jgi:hypothetical protein